MLYSNVRHSHNELDNADLLAPGQVQRDLLNQIQYLHRRVLLTLIDSNPPNNKEIENIRVAKYYCIQ